MTTMTFRPASPKQTAFITKLIGEKQIDATRELDTLLEARMTGDLSGRDASRLIDLLMASPRKARANALTEPGMYQTGERIFRVQISKESGHLYAKELILVPALHADGTPKVKEDGTPKLKGKLVFAKGAMGILTTEHKLTLEAAKLLCKGYEVCIVCGAELEDPKSVERAIGPTCARSFR